jgi:GT2 family glycosyltransferase
VKQTPLVSIIIPAWNGKNYIEDCLISVFSQDYSDFEVIVVDNASNDSTPDRVAEHFPSVKLIRNEHNLGYAGGCNVGLKVARGDVLVLLNQDTIVAPEWLGTLCIALSDRRVGIAGCRIFYPDGETIQHAGGWIEWPVGAAHHYGQGEPDSEAWNIARKVEYVTGAAMAIKREVLETVGFLDEEFWPAYFEDADFCVRVREAGYEVWYIPSATLTHVETGSLTEQSLVWQLYHRGRLRFVLKHIPPDKFLKDFVSAEERYQSSVINLLGNQPLCKAYLEAILRVVPILSDCWQAETQTLSAVTTALQQLYTLAWVKGWPKNGNVVMTSTARTAVRNQLGENESSITVTDIPHLQEFEFRSDIPMVGAFISRFRSWWYGIAAKWSVRHLMHQQEAINQRYIKALERGLAELAEENAFLATEIANLNLQFNRNITSNQTKTDLSGDKK